jgi:DNA segregation ATPase FtsK/SpoIIIE, S-DNA-T family
MNEFTGVVSFAAALIWFIALATHEPSDPVWFFNDAGSGDVENFAGRFGAFIALASLQVVGYSSYLLPLVLGVIGWHYFWCRTVDAGYTKLVGAVLFVMCLSGLLALAHDAFAPGQGDGSLWGGWIGSTTASLLRAFFNRTGATICLLTVLVLAVIMSTQFSFGRAAAALGRYLRSTPGLVDRLRDWRDRRQRERQRQQVIEKHVKRAGKERAPEIATRAAESAERLKAARTRGPADDEDNNEDGDGEVVERPKPLRQTAPAIRGAPSKAPVAQPLPLTDASAAARTPAERRQDGYTPPPVTLFDAPKDHRKIDERELMDSARLLEEKSREFAVEGSVVQIHPGPVVTTYEFKPDAGVKYSRITGLADDLCLAMQAESVLIDRIPGKSTVGIQIPNRHREPITLRELLESETYQRSASKLGMALGKGIHGDPIVGDLGTMPHLLIAGSTGAGKSVSVNAMLSSILFRATPDDVRLILIDPKRLELGMYEGIPHLLTPVVVDPKQAANALRWAVREMEERYKSLAKLGVRNIEQYNRNVAAMLSEQPDAKAPDGSALHTLPCIIVVIDELADLMMVAGKEVEESIARLAQMARAVGIHLILATQRPSVDVITGVIKANLPARIAFRVASRIDSRTILDGNGAEQLLGKGDMLLLPPSSSRYLRIHGPYISEQETARLCSFLRKQGKPTYDTTITAEDKAGPERVEMEKDDLYDEAARIVVSSGQASISYLQRRLRIGFSRAARLIDMMELEGVVSPASGGKREVLVDQSYFEEVDAQLR